MDQEIMRLINKIDALEKEETFLCDHQSWGAAEGVNKRKCFQIKKLLTLVTADQKSNIEQIEVKEA